MFILLGFILLQIAISKSEYFNIKHITLNGVPNEEQDRVRALYEEEFFNRKIYLLTLSDISDASHNLLPAYKFKSAKRHWPDRYEIFLDKRVPLYVVQAQNGIFFIDNENIIMDSANAFIGYEVQIKYDQNLLLGDKISDHALLAALAYSSKDKIVEVKNSEISITLDEGGKVLLPKDSSIKNYEELSRMLQKIIQKYTIENKYIETIDLRFSKPLIKSSPKNN